MVEVELNAELIAEYLDQRELYGVAHIMIRRRGDQGNDEAGEPRTYLGTALVGRAEDNRGQVYVTGSTAVPEGPRLPASSPWAGDPVPMEEPLGFSIDELPALGGASELLRSVEISEAVQAGQESDANGEQR
jgi:hypothetical protein